MQANRIFSYRNEFIFTGKRKPALYSYGPLMANIEKCIRAPGHSTVYTYLMKPFTNKQNE